jgi:hypothetical protein
MGFLMKKLLIIAVMAMVTSYGSFAADVSRVCEESEQVRRTGANVTTTASSVEQENRKPVPVQRTESNWGTSGNGSVPPPPHLPVSLPNHQVVTDELGEEKSDSTESPLVVNEIEQAIYSDNENLEPDDLGEEEEGGEPVDWTKSVILPPVKSK